MKAEDEAEQQQELCPITLQALPVDPLDVGRVWKNHSGPVDESEGCGHRCDLRALIRYIHQGGGRTNDGAIRSSSSSVAMCPVCLKSPVVSISDGLAGQQEYEKNGNVSFRSVAFRYGKVTYRLSVEQIREDVDEKDSVQWWKFMFGSSPRPSLTRRTAGTAQERIVHVLGLSEPTLKVLYKGKVIYPNKALSARQCSDLILDISQQDDPSHNTITTTVKPSVTSASTLTNRSTKTTSVTKSSTPPLHSTSFKPSLVVMGTLLGTELPHMTTPGNATRGFSILALLSSLVASSSLPQPLAWICAPILGLVYGMRWTLSTLLGTVQVLSGGVVLFLKSFVVDPTPPASPPSTPPATRPARMVNTGRFH